MIRYEVYTTTIINIMIICSTNSFRRMLPTLRANMKFGFGLNIHCRQPYIS